MDKFTQKRVDLVRGRLNDSDQEAILDFLMAAFEQSQVKIDGVVSLAIYKGNVTVIGRTSPVSLYNSDLASMDMEGGYNQEEAAGFININAIRLKAHNILLKQKNPYDWRDKLVRKK